jgi:transposase
VPTIPDDQAIASLKRLLAQRTLYVRQRAALKNARKVSHLDFSGAEPDALHAMNDEMITTFTKHIQEIEAMIHELFREEVELRSNAELLQSIPGIGPVTAWYLIACTKNFTSFQNARQFACYAGIAPFPYQSGSSIQGNAHVHYLANKTIKALLSNCVLTAIKHDPAIHAYFHRKRSEGKAFGVVANAIKNKLIARVFSVIKRQTQYVVLPSYTS